PTTYHTLRLHDALPIFLDMAVDVLDHDDGVVDDEADGEHHRQKRQQVDRIAEDEQHEADADQRQRDGDDRHHHRAEGAEEEQDEDRKSTRLNSSHVKIS